MGDWVYDNPGKCVLILVAFVFWLAYVGAQAQAAQQQKFMDACMEDRKEYECKAMWRAGNTDVVYIYTR